MLRHCFPAVTAIVVSGFVFPGHAVVAQQIVAHRGASADAPENTLAAFRLAWEQESDAVEGDFYLTRDRQIVTIHDKTTERTSGVDLDVREQTLSQLRSLDVGKWKGPSFAGERIPTLEEVCNIIRPGGKLILEIKDSPRIVPVIVRALENTQEFAALLPDRLVIIAFDENVVAACKRSMPDVKALWLTGFKADELTGKLTPSIGSILGTLARIQADGLDCKASDHIDRAFVRQLRNAGYEFHVWTVDEPEIAARFQRLGVDSITTNRPAFIRKSLMLEPVVVP